MDLSEWPPADPPVHELIRLIRDRRVVVLAGAGCSTDSGIPDYRGPDGSRRVRTPVQYQEFVRSGTARIRYWARSAVGWPRFSSAAPNAAHRALAELEEMGTVSGIISQNVDGLHQAAGSRRVVELHGSLAAIRCLGCGSATGRAEFQDRLHSLNPEWVEGLARRADGPVESAPDGDAELPDWALESFRVPDCVACGGTLKPAVVFFGENVPGETVDEAWRLFAEGEVLLIVGSSLTVYSGRRFVYGAQRAGIPIAIVNLGQTRADEAAVVRVEGRLGTVLPELVRSLRVSTEARLTPYRGCGP